MRSSSANPGMRRLVGAEKRAVEMEDEVARESNIKLPGHAPFEVPAVEARVEFSAEGIRRQLDRDAVVDHVNDAANRPRTEENRGRSAHDFDALADAAG